MRIPDELLKSVCFLCVELKGGKDAGKFQLLGTGFFVGIQQEGWDFCYLFTARHILDEATRAGHHTLFARVNKKNGQVGTINLGTLNNWQYYPDFADDIAVLQFAPDIDEFDFGVIPVSMLLSFDDMLNRSIGVGDDLFTVGLFTLHSGKNLNIPIVRTGIISAMPHEPLLDKSGREYFAYLAELRSIGGLSGSPVFVYLDYRRLYNPLLQEDKQWQLFLLGLVRGHWDLKREFTDNADTLNNDVVAGYNKGENLNVGIAVVTPATAILAFLRNERLVKGREDFIKMLKEESQKSKDVNTTNDNFTSDDFQTALKKVSRKVTSKKEKKGKD